MLQLVIRVLVKDESLDFDRISILSELSQSHNGVVTTNLATIMEQSNFLECLFKL